MSTLHLALIAWVGQSFVTGPIIGRWLGRGR
jgi:hypothetical protein